IPCAFQWTILGAGAGSTVIKQYTNNVACIELGYNESGVSCHTVRLNDIEFQYANAQTSSYTNGNALHFRAMYFESNFSRLKFSGWYGIKVKSGIGGPWGCVFDELVFGAGCYGGAMDWTGSVNAVP